MITRTKVKMVKPKVLTVDMPKIVKQALGH